MFQLLDCSNCKRTFSLRRDLPESTQLKCPNCGNRVRLGELLDAFYPEWDVVESSPAGAATVVEDQLVDALDIEQRDVVESGAATLDFDHMAGADTYEMPSDVQAEIDETEAAALETVDEFLTSGQGAEPAAQSQLVTKSHGESKRNRKPAKSPIWSLIQVMLGGLAAIPVSLLLIWYVLGKDVAGAGPAVAQYVPWIVPAKFHPYAEKPQPPVRPSKTTDVGTGLPSVNLDAESSRETASTDKSIESVKPSSSSDEKMAEKMPSKVEPKVESADDVKAESKDDSKVDSPASNGVTKAASGDAPKPEGNIISDIQSLESKLMEWAKIEAQDADGLRAAVLDLSGSLSAMAERIEADSGGGSAPRQVRDRLTDVTRQLQKQPRLLAGLNSFLKAQAEGRFQFQGAGRVLMFEATSTEDIPDAVVVHPVDSAPGDLKTLRIVVGRSMASSIEPGTKLLLLGNVHPRSETLNGAKPEVKDASPDAEAAATTDAGPEFHAVFVSVL